MMENDPQKPVSSCSWPPALSGLAAYLSLFFRLVLGTVFLVSGLAKILDPIRFLFTLRAFRLLPDILERLSAVCLPWLELLLGLALLMGLWHRAAALLLSLLNLAFMLAILSVMIRGIEIDCGCYGLLADVLHLPDSADYTAVIRNGLFLCMGLWVLFSEKSRLSLENYLARKYRDHPFEEI